MEYLSPEDLLNIHSVVIDETGGTHGVRDQGALLSLGALPQQAVYGRELYIGIYAKAAVYIRSIIFNHPFIDGNKRSAMMSADVFLQLNGYQISVPKGGVEEFALTIIRDRYGIEEIATWLKAHTVRI